jgi:hypothetical protein
VARRLRKDHGLCLVDFVAKQQLKAAVQALESECTPPPPLTWTETMSGDWDLVCTTVSKVDDYENRDKLLQVSNPYLTVTQRIMSSAPMVNGHGGTVESSPLPNSSSTIHRIDHVLEYRPPSTISYALDNLPEQSRVVLVHQAKVASSTEASNNNADESFTIQLRLESIVLEMAVTSTVLDPFGPDVQRRMHMPIAEFGSTGSFVTTYIDDDLRISRGGLDGSVQPLRIFVRSKN